MLFVDNAGMTDPRVNLALEEHLLRNVRVDEPILLFYINEPAVILGRNQNTLAEIDPDYVAEKGIHVVRRLSGGGAVFHDLGNLNFSFITNGDEHLHDFARFTEPVVAVLRGLGVEAALQGKSDIFANGRKISGNAQYLSRGRMFSHGTLLFDTSIEQMLLSLNPRQVQIESKAVQSVRNFVANIRDLLPSGWDIARLRQALLEGVFGSTAVPTYDLSDEDWAQVQEIADTRYRTWEWNYGRSPDFNVQKQGKTPAGHVEAHIDVADGVIRGAKFLGNFASTQDVAVLEEQLVGVRYEKGALVTAVTHLNLTPYFGALSHDEFVTLLY
ncbi:MAG: lipoate--protein ligase [Ardenticatenaceae bacterium]|nr:lipoate--protein ligase [Anaerolineales bacterium]MCA9999562.1 lipoate--protein ligase [Anaerolineales bacterium]MCB8920097.1 lipoate--protein ligase [Ardenticatenaceae bacterium]MCB8991790.1 lipoate--protein ligase [Ardenticatenaceae bacterium]